MRNKQVLTLLVVAALAGTAVQSVVAQGYNRGGYSYDRSYFAQTPDNIRSLRNSGTEITMSRNCVITYDARGYRVRSYGRILVTP